MQAPFVVGDCIEVEIEKMAFGPAALARYQGFVVFVPFAAAGDRLKVRVSILKSRHAEAEIVEILKDSSERTAPLCPVYGQCGGCDWQHLSYQAQIRWKQKIVEDMLNRITKDPFVMAPLVPSAQPFHYRNRVQLKAHHKSVGFFGRHSHDIVSIESCPLMEAPLNQVLQMTHAKLQVEPQPELTRFQLQLLRNGKVANSVDPHSPEGPGFSQIHREQNTQLIETALRWLTESSAQAAWTQGYDLYAGAGNFTFPFVQAFPKASFLAIESHPRSVAEAQAQLRSLALGPRRLEFICSPVEVALRRLAFVPKGVAFVDPPRVGCEASVIEALAHSDLSRIFYLSCDPPSLVRDLQRLQDAQPGKWQILRAQCFDLFPQTHHVETLVEIARR